MIRRVFASLFTSDNFIQVGIAFIGLLILHNFIVAVYSESALEERTEFTRSHQFILQKIDQISYNVNLIDLGVRGYYMIPKENLKSPLEIARRQHREDLDTLMNLMSTLAYAQTDSLEMVDEWILGYFALADQGIDFIDQGLPENTSALYRSDPGYTLWSNYSTVQESMRRHVNQLDDVQEARYASITGYAFFAQLLLLVAGGIILVIVVYRLMRQNKVIKGHFDRIIESDRTYIFTDVNSHDQLNNTQAIDLMENHLQKATAFIKQITKGNFEVQWDGMRPELHKLNKNTLAGELIHMRNQMAEVKKKEQDRFWLSEGISKFSEIIRTYQDDMQTMNDKLIGGIVKYLDCNQGALFYLDADDDSRLTLTSCYAYDKIRFVENSVSVGNGILGQAFLEGEIIVLKEIPENYVNITSGLGESLPRNLAVVPLKVNEKVEGVIELASFKPLSPIKLEFLNKIAEIVASAIFTSRNASEMKRLLEESEESSAALKAQEEEMRQNMEELQAMQENAARHS